MGQLRAGRQHSNTVGAMDRLCTGVLSWEAVHVTNISLCIAKTVDQLDWMTMACVHAMDVAVKPQGWGWYALWVGTCAVCASV